MKACIRVSLALVGLLLLTRTGWAECCAHCGCQSNCRKICRAVPDKKKVPKVTYTCECEDFCVPGRSQRCGWKCECEKDCCSPCGQSCREVPNYVPTCAEVRTRKKLVKHEETKEVCTVKWVVETVCDRCACQCDCAEAGPAGNPAVNSVEKVVAENEVDMPSAPQPKRSMLSWLHH